MLINCEIIKIKYLFIRHNQVECKLKSEESTKNIKENQKNLTKCKETTGDCLKRPLFGDFAFSQDGVTDWVYSPLEYLKTEPDMCNNDFLTLNIRQQPRTMISERVGRDDVI